MGLDMYLRGRRYISGYDFSGGTVPIVVVNGIDGIQDALEGDAPTITVEDSPVERSAYKELVEMFGVGDAVDPDSPSADVEFTIGYWRKANQIHNWFVQNVQGGVDECQEAYCTREQLHELRGICLRVLDSTELVKGTVFNGETFSKEHPEGIANQEEGEIIADPRVAHELLPTSEGFFFGSTDYDQWYWSDIKDTVKIIDRALAMPECWTFYYQSSW